MRAMIVVGLALLAGVAHAQDNNPNSAAYHALHNAQSPNYVGPRPRQPEAQPAGYWEKTWGAIATSDSGGALGTALGASTEAQAKQFALSDCERKGGGGCRSSFAFRNQCAVAVIGSKTFRMFGAPTIADASNDGLRDCAAANRDKRSCRIYYSACTEPKFREY